MTPNQKRRALIAAKEVFSFKTLRGDVAEGLDELDGVGLVGRDLEIFCEHAPLIDYVVISYETPIYWTTLTGEQHVIDSCPSKTTAGHRNLCPGRRQYREGT